MTYEQILIFMLFIALVARELLPMVLRKFGLINNGKDKVEEILNLISNHQHTEAKEEFDKMNESLKRIEENLIRNFAILHEASGRQNEKLTGILAKMNNR